MSKESLAGSCLCGAVRYECGSLTGPIVYCHCPKCQKAHATAFAATARVLRESFRWVEGADFVASYASSPGKLRHFCPKCGSQMMAEWLEENEVILRLGVLDTPLSEQGVAHLWTAEKASWYEPSVDLPCIAEGRQRMPR